MTIIKAKNWTTVRQKLSSCSERDLLGLISELYELSKENKNFLEARFLQDTSALDRYKAHIKRYLAPNEPWKASQQISIREAKKAISDYKKASANAIHLIDLMVYYVECGTDFSCEFGDMDETYYASLESMFDKAVTLMKKQALYNVEDFIRRLEVVVRKASSFGWGYYDIISEILKEAYGSERLSH